MKHGRSMVTKLHKGLRRSVFSVIREVYSVFEEEGRKKTLGKGVLELPRRLPLGSEEKIAVGMYLLWVVKCLSTCSRRMKESQK